MKYGVSKPTYDSSKSWEYNYTHGPFFKGNFPPLPTQKRWKLFSHDLISPLGVAAGPLPNAKWLKTYLKLGFGSVILKTVRSKAHKSHPAPNITFVQSGQTIKPDSKPIVVTTKKGDLDKLSITNSFGNPSKDPKEWTAEIKKTKKALGDGQIFGVSVYGTQSEKTTLLQLAKDYAKTAKIAKVAGADFIEANLACPNVTGSENPFLYKDAESVSLISREIKSAIGDLPLVLKIGYFENYEELLSVLKKIKGNFEGVSAINTIQKKVIDSHGRNALPGREVSGVCGFAIKKYGLETVKKLKTAQKDLKIKFEIIGVGGVMSPKDAKNYLEAGADHVHSATAVMFNPYLAYQLNLSLKLL